jgi:hypothetical protein
MGEIRHPSHPPPPPPKKKKKKEREDRWRRRRRGRETEKEMGRGRRGERWGSEEGGRILNTSYTSPCPPAGSQTKKFR